ncbi:unnamed protein product [Litomosoides sigmodontis]|uniref:Uncharacterized protein n=1 Tax=Litomosoides sigmodontis TaxID=42156 RepID=A0A3P6SPE9_LITSI|nr:unnamed protein product [Litomosoides sigmodontis]
MLHLSIAVQTEDCNIGNYFNSTNDSSTIIGVTSACTIFAVPHWLIANSNFLRELKLIDSDRRKICHGVNVHILKNGQVIVLFVPQARLAVVVSCAWKFSGKLFYCNPENSQVLFVHEQRKACTNLIQFPIGFSFFCAVSDNLLEKITYFGGKRRVKLIRTKSSSLFLRENSNIVLITNDTSDRAGFYEMHIFDNVYVEQLTNNENKGKAIIGLLEPRKYAVKFMEKKLKNISVQHNLPDYVTMHQTTMNQTKWYCIARFDESDYLDAKRYKKPYFMKFMLMLYKSIAESRKRTNIFKEPVIGYGVADYEAHYKYNVTVAILMIPVLTVLSAVVTLICWCK